MTELREQIHGGFSTVTRAVLALAILFPAITRAQTIAIRNATVIDVSNGRATRATAIMIDSNRIARVGSAPTTLGANTRIIDATGLFVIPGLWDMHVHIHFSGDTSRFATGRRLLLPLFIVNGVTGVRDMGSHLEGILATRDSIATHQLVGPRVLTSGPMLDGPKSGYAAAIRVADAEQARATVRKLKESGVDFIKTQSQLPRAAYFALADESARLGIPFEGHVPDAIRASEAITSHQRSFEHLLGVFEASSRIEDSMVAGARKGQAQYLATFDPRRERAIVARLAKAGVWQCPTVVSDLNTAADLASDPGLIFWGSQGVDAWRQSKERALDVDSAALDLRNRYAEYELRLVRDLHRAKVPFLAGSDAPAGYDLVPGSSLHRELEWLVTAGFTPLEALQTATINPALFLGKTGDFGAIAAGRKADLVLLERNPLIDIRNTRTVVGVVADGRYYSRQDLDRMRLELMARR